jgi:hypothetical protein
MTALGTHGTIVFWACIGVLVVLVVLFVVRVGRR